MTKTPLYKSRDVLLPWADPWLAQTRLRLFDDAGRVIAISDAPLSSDGSEAEEDDTLPDPATVFVAPRPRSPEARDLESLRVLIGAELEHGPKLLADVQKALRTRSKLDQKFIEGCLRLLLADETIEAFEAGKQTALFLRLSSDGRKEEGLRAYAAAFAHELSVQSQQVGRLIGHAPTVGGHREELLRALLQKHIPQRYHVATGFVLGRPNQLDILIYDRLEYGPLFREGDLVVVSPESVRAIIEVKSTLTSGELKDALRHLNEATPAHHFGPPIFTGVFGYDGARAQTLAKAIQRFHSLEVADDEPLEDTDLKVIGDIDDVVTAVCVLRKSLLVTEFRCTDRTEFEEHAPAIVQLNTLSRREAEAALFFELLMRHLRHPFDGPHPDSTLGDLLSADVSPTHLAWVQARQEMSALLDADDLAHLSGRVRAYKAWRDGARWQE